MTLTARSPHGRAVVIGASGGIGGAMAQALDTSGFKQVVGLNRPSLDVTDETSVANAAQSLAVDPEPIRLICVATGVLAGQDIAPEKTWRDLDAASLAQYFAINTIGPALIMKYFLPLLPRVERSVFAVLSARVGSIGDNNLGGWYGYRASKAALNQMVRTASIELTRARPQAICVALHPGTVATPLSAPFMKSGLDIQSPDQAAARLIKVMDNLQVTDSGGFFDHLGQSVPW